VHGGSGFIGIENEQGEDASAKFSTGAEEILEKTAKLTFSL
jgi:hypothetical protein